MAFIPALAFRQQNVVALIDGSRTKIPACALSTVTGIPLLRLHGDSRSLNGCEKAVQMSAGYRDYAHATLDILNTFHWEKIALVFDGKLKHVPQFITLNAVIVLLLYLFFVIPQPKSTFSNRFVIQNPEYSTRFSCCFKKRSQAIDAKV